MSNGRRFFSGLIILSGCALGAITAGCIAVGGSDNYQQPTLGKQLQDLKVAHDTGAINDAEYTDSRAKLLNGSYFKPKS